MNDIEKNYTSHIQDMEGNSMKKRTLISLLLILVIVISGCSVKTKTESQAETAPSDTTEIAQKPQTLSCLP